MRAGPVRACHELLEKISTKFMTGSRPPALHSIYIMRPTRALAFLVGAELIELAAEALWIASARAALFLLGDFGIHGFVRNMPQECGRAGL